MSLYPHNQVTYDKAVSMLNEKRRCAIIQATGTGKSFVTMELLRTIFKNLRVLYAVPTISIAESIELYDDWNFGNVQFVTYSGLENISHKYDVLILDELHRAGARTWRTYVEKLRTKVTYLLGLSATPYRFLDNKRNMAEEIFGDDVVYGPDFETAIKSGILPGFNYFSILTDVREYVKKIDKYNPNYDIKFKIASMRLDEYNLSERVKDKLPVGRRKCIIFYPDSASLEEADSDICMWFGQDIKIYQLYSRQSRAEQKRNLLEYNTCNSDCVIKAVDMLNEGIHIDGVNLLIFARRTVSGNVFIQQIGRALSASTKGVKPTIIDLVQNYNNIKVLKQCINIKDTHRSKSGHTDINLVTMQQIMISYDDVMLELEEVLAKVSNTWSDYEDSIIRKYYSVDGGDVYKRLDGKTKNQCMRRAKVIGASKSNRWTSEEDAIIAEYYQYHRDSIWKKLPGRTQGAIDARAVKLGYAPKWTAEDDLKLMTRWSSEGLSMFGEFPGRTFNDIVKRAEKLGLGGLHEQK